MNNESQHWADGHGRPELAAQPHRRPHRHGVRMIYVVLQDEYDRNIMRCHTDRAEAEEFVARYNDWAASYEAMWVEEYPDGTPCPGGYDGPGWHTSLNVTTEDDFDRRKARWDKEFPKSPWEEDGERRDGRYYFPLHEFAIWLTTPTAEPRVIKCENVKGSPHWNIWVEGADADEVRKLAYSEADKVMSQP